MKCLYLATMSNSPSPSPDDFLASTADLVSVLAHFAQSSRRCSSQHQRDRQLVQTVLSSLHAGHSKIDQPALTPAVVLAAVPASAPRRTEAGKVQRRQCCQCGHCKWCLDNARWERVFNEKFLDPMYYGRLTVRHNSTLAGAR